MTAPISFTVRPPTSSAPHRPSPLANGARGNGRVGPPSRRLFENGDQSDSDEDDFGREDRRAKGERAKEERNGRTATAGYVPLRNRLSPSDAHRPSKPSGPLVIPALPNKDWRESSSRRVPSFRPEAPQRDASDLITHERIGDGQAKSGLERFGRKREAKEEDVKMEPEVKLEEGVEASSHPTDNFPQVKKEPLTIEEQALQELLAGETEKESAEDRAQRELVIAMQANNVRVLSESEALQRDIHALPEESTLEDFEAVPISAFGIAALRGMGWDPKSAENVKARVPERRPQLLGLGATPLEVSLPPGSGKSRKELEREKEKREKKKTRDEKTGRGFSVANLLMKTPTGTPGGSGRSTPALVSRAGSVDTGTGTDSEGGRRRRREDEGGAERESKRRDDRDDRYETEEERARRKARERERYDRGDKYERSDRDRERRDRDGGGRDRDRERDRDRNGRDDDRDRRRDRY